MYRNTARLALAFACALALPLALAAQSSLSANDLKPAQLTAPAAFEGFTLQASADKGVTVEAIDVARTAPDGEVFNARIKLNGAGSADFRSIRFRAAGPCSLVLYLASSSKTDARVLKLLTASGEAVADLAAPPDDGTKASIATVAIPAAGEYLIWSASGGINVYAVVLK